MLFHISSSDVVIYANSCADHSHSLTSFQVCQGLFGAIERAQSLKVLWIIFPGKLWIPTLDQMDTIFNTEKIEN